HTFCPSAPSESKRVCICRLVYSKCQWIFGGHRQHVTAPDQHRQTFLTLLRSFLADANKEPSTSSQPRTALWRLFERFRELLGSRFEGRGVFSSIHVGTAVQLSLL